MSDLAAISTHTPKRPRFHTHDNDCIYRKKKMALQFWKAIR